MNKDQLTVKIMTPKQLLFQGPALAVSSRNTHGNFDIIPQHANFITIIDNQPITVLKPDQSNQTFNFSQAIIYHFNNQVSIYADPKSANFSLKR